MTNVTATEYGLIAALIAVAGISATIATATPATAPSAVVTPDTGTRDLSPLRYDSDAMVFSDMSDDCSVVTVSPYADRDTSEAALHDAASVVGDSGCVIIRMDSTMATDAHTLTTPAIAAQPE